MKGRMLKSGLVMFVCAAAAGSLMANDDGDRDHGHNKDGRFVVRAELIGLQEVPAVSTPAHGSFRAVVDTVANTITYRLTYDALEGMVTQSHVHFGQRNVNGGISFFLCSNLPSPPPGTQACPTPPATGPAPAGATSTYLLMKSSPSWRMRWGTPSRISCP